MPKSFGECCCCEHEIVDGDEYYSIDGDIYCEDCAREWLEEHHYVADIAGEMADRWYDERRDEGGFL